MQSPLPGYGIPSLGSLRAGVTPHKPLCTQGVGADTPGVCLCGSAGKREG